MEGKVRAIRLFLQVGVSTGLCMDPTGIFWLLTGCVALILTVNGSLYLSRSVTVSLGIICVHVYEYVCVVTTSIIMTMCRSTCVFF